MAATETIRKLRHPLSAMWRARVESLDNSNSQRTSIQSGSSHLTFSEVVGLWQDNTRFRDFFISLLSMAPWPA